MKFLPFGTAAILRVCIESGRIYHLNSFEMIVSHFILLYDISHVIQTTGPK